ncbi:WD40 repeat-like protein [Rozella allomycis CSF55]|uniref:Cilia- and flagella-associated protein 251 n=1 Tax=Rozella allomycis (strain CSF55) TaxID=988480 RepID=A0A4P9YPK2_ROZAC|nr:WD40 repeat-like protein [Rozella allomycis CSF55]
MNSLDLHWSYGINQDIPKGFHNLIDESQKRNEIVANGASYDNKWLLTGDAGEDSMIIIWDSKSGMPIKTIFDPHNGIGSCALSMNMPQKLAIWEWTLADNNPLFEVEIETDDFHDCLLFNPDTSFEIVSNGRRSLKCFVWDKATGIVQFSPDVNAKEFNINLSELTESCFVESVGQIITGTSTGELIVWDQRNLKNISQKSEMGHRSAIKFIKLHNSSVNAILNVHRQFIITAGEEGSIKIFDNNIAVVSRDGAINLLNVNIDNSSPFTITTLMNNQPSHVYAIDVHPNESLLVVVKKEFKNQSISSLSFSHDGKIVAVGFEDGILTLIDSRTFGTLIDGSFEIGKHRIIKIEFSPDNEFCAIADSQHALALLKLVAEKWIYLGKYRVHSKEIKNVLFCPAEDGNQLRLISVSEDRHLVEFDLQSSNIQDGLKIKFRKALEQRAAITGATWYFPGWTKERYLLTCNTEFKFRIYRADSFMCRYTFCAPIYAGNIRHLAFLPPKCSKRDKTIYLSYASEDKIVGLIKAPIDGNPMKTIGLTGHSKSIFNLKYSSDGAYLFTCGGDDYCINMWKTDFDAFEAQCQLGGSGFDPFISMLDGGFNGPVYKKIEDLFYFAQLYDQGFQSSSKRIASDYLPISQVVLVFQALGVFLSEFDAENLLNEIRYKDVLNSAEYNMYVNHRPAFEPDEVFLLDNIKTAMTKADPNDTPLMNELVNLLQRIYDSRRGSGNCKSGSSRSSERKRHNSTCTSPLF